jgi:ankyrin repeat protein
MTRKDARQLVRKSDGNLCIRYVEDPKTKQPLFAGQLIQISRRTTSLAAGVVGATLSLASLTYSQGSPRIPTEITRSADRTDKDDLKLAAQEQIGSAKITGMIVGPDGNVFPGARVLVKEIKTNTEYTVVSGTDGTFSVPDLPAGNYYLIVQAGIGFKEIAVADIDLAEDTTKFQVVNLEAQEQRFFVSGGMAISTTITIRSPLAAAVYAEELDEVNDLLARGTDPDDQNEDGETALFIAVEDGSTEIVRSLLKFSADVNIRNKKGENALFRVNDDTPLELVELLLKADADVKATDEEGRTAFLIAAANASSKVLKAMLDAHAEVNKADKQGWTPLMKAADDGNIEKVQLLLFAGADVNARNNKGENAWDQTGDDDIEALLVAFGSETTEEIEGMSDPEDDADGEPNR